MSRSHHDVPLVHTAGNPATGGAVSSVVPSGTIRIPKQSHSRTSR